MPFITDEKIFREVEARVVVIEFRKRRLLHAHFFLWLLHQKSIYLVQLSSIQLYRLNFRMSKNLSCNKLFFSTTCMTFAAIANPLQFARLTTFTRNTSLKTQSRRPGMMKLKCTSHTVEDIPTSRKRLLPVPTARLKDLQSQEQLINPGQSPAHRNSA